VACQANAAFYYKQPKASSYQLLLAHFALTLASEATAACGFLVKQQFAWDSLLSSAVAQA
jgi:outer membrane lipopolysaccharide assembly protein LptE/RlpB